MDKNQEQDIYFVELAIEHEVAMSELYETFYDLVPCCEDLWRSLADEEIQHGQRLQVLLHEIKQGNASLAQTRHNTQTLEASLRSLRERIRAWQNTGVGIKEAFEYALLLEGGIIEESVFTPLEGDSELTSQILWEMRTGTSNHFDRLREEYEKNSFGAGFIRHLAATFKSFLSITDDKTT